MSKLTKEAYNQASQSCKSKSENKRKPKEMYNIFMIYKFQKTNIIDIVGPWETLCHDVMSSLLQGHISYNDPREPDSTEPLYIMKYRHEFVLTVGNSLDKDNRPHTYLGHSKEMCSANNLSPLMEMASKLCEPEEGYLSILSQWINFLRISN